MTYCEGSPLSVTIPVGSAKSDPFYYGVFGYGGFIVPSNITNTTITFEVGDHPTDLTRFKPAYDATGAAVSMTVAADRAYPLPVALQGSVFVRIVEGANQTGSPAVIPVTRKG